jgi:hypothetical protein
VPLCPSKIPDLGPKPGRNFWRSVTNRLSYGTPPKISVGIVGYGLKWNMILREGHPLEFGVFQSLVTRTSSN